MAACDSFVFLDNVQFQKRGFQNRTETKAPQGAIWLTVPVKASRSLTIAATPIVHDGWQRKHLKTLRMHYAKAAYAEWIDDGLEQIILGEWEFLADLNQAVTQWLFARLDIKTPSIRASDLDVGGSKQELMVNICSALGADRYLSGQGAKAYQTPEAFAEQGIELVYQEYRNPVYQQCHPRAGFVPNLSAIDLILNTGPAAASIMADGFRPPAA